MNIVVTGFAGLEGSRLIFENRICREKLLNRYSKSFFGVFENEQSSELRPEGLEQLYEQEKEQGRAADVHGAVRIGKNMLSGDICDPV